MQMKSQAKHIAFKVINRMFGGNGFAMKYVYAKQIIVLIKDHTSDPKLIKESYNQIRRGLTKLGYARK